MNKSIGALWKKESSNGNTFLSGKLDINGATHQIVVFKNGFKEKDNQPDYHIYPSEPRQHAGTSSPPVVPEGEEISVDDIAF